MEFKNWVYRYMRIFNFLHYCDFHMSSTKNVRCVSVCMCVFKPQNIHVYLVDCVSYTVILN